ncbi:MAG: hypothetical protein U0795_06330 [Pirellulales bacterium]
MYRVESIQRAAAEDWRSTIRRWYAGFKQWMMTNPRNDLVWHTVGIETGPKCFESSRPKTHEEDWADDDFELFGD